MVDAPHGWRWVPVEIPVAFIVVSDQIGEVFESFDLFLFVWVVHVVAVYPAQSMVMFADCWEQHTCGLVANHGNFVMSNNKSWCSSTPPAGTSPLSCSTKVSVEASIALAWRVS